MLMYSGCYGKRILNVALISYVIFSQNYQNIEIVIEYYSPSYLHSRKVRFAHLSLEIQRSIVKLHLNYYFVCLSTFQWNECGRVERANEFIFHFFGSPYNSSLLFKSQNGRLELTYVVKNTFLPFAGVRRMQARERRAYVHVGAKTVPTKYCTPAHTHTRPRTWEQNDFYI